MTGLDGIRIPAKIDDKNNPAYQARWYELNKTKHLANNAAWRKRCPEKDRAKSLRFYKRKYAEDPEFREKEKARARSNCRRRWADIKIVGEMAGVKVLSRMSWGPKNKKRLMEESMTYLEVLNKVWANGALPKEVEIHYYFFWFVELGGNIIQMAKKLGIHRNTVQGHFHALKLGNKAVKMRKVIQAMQADQFSEAEIIRVLYRKFVPKLSVFPIDLSDGLCALWEYGFSHKSLQAHFLIWAIRRGIKKERALRKLDLSYRHGARLLAGILKPKTRVGKDLAVLKVKPKEIYSAKYLKNLKRKAA